MSILRLLLALLTFGLGPSALAQQLLYVHTDHLNTPRMVTDGTGTAVWRWDQIEPFGDNPPDEDPDGNGGLGHMPLRFPGQYFDKETNLAYNYFRDYDSGIGRYVQSDPIGLDGGINTYAYVSSNPLAFVDLDGLEPGGGRGERGATGGASGQRTNRPNKNCREFDPPDPDFVECRHHQTGKWIKKPRPAGMPLPAPKTKQEMCDADCQKTAVWVVGSSGLAYLTYRCVRMLPSLLPPLWPTIIPNAVMP